MKELKLFVCDVCGTQYNNPKTCQECESSHVKPKKIVNARYVPLKNNITGYPHKIEVEFEDGATIVFSR